MPHIFIIYFITRSFEKHRGCAHSSNTYIAPLILQGIYQVLGIESRLRHAVLYNNKDYQKRFHFKSYSSSV